MEHIIAQKTFELDPDIPDKNIHMIAVEELLKKGFDPTFILSEYLKLKF